MLDELRPDWAIEALTMVAGEGGGRRLAVIGNTFSAVGDALPSGRLLLFDLSRRLSDSGKDPWRLRRGSFLSLFIRTSLPANSPFGIAPAA